MLIKATRADIERRMDFAYSLALDQTRSGYPLFSDGISTKEQFVSHVWRSYESPDRDILLFESNGAVEGWIQFFYLEEDRYLQTNGFLISRNTEQALVEFMDYARARFAGYDLYWGFPKRNARAISFLQKTGCRLIEASYHDVFVFDGHPLPPQPAGLVRVTQSNFSEFHQIYHVDSDTYWNAERILSTLSEWTIYLQYRDDAPVGYVCAKDGEIFSLGYRDGVFDPRVYRALVTAILHDLRPSGSPLVFFNDEESQSAALEIGFSCVGEYILHVQSL